MICARKHQVQVAKRIHQCGAGNRLSRFASPSVN